MSLFVFWGWKKVILPVKCVSSKVENYFSCLGGITKRMFKGPHEALV